MARPPSLALSSVSPSPLINAQLGLGRSPVAQIGSITLNGLPRDWLSKLLILIKAGYEMQVAAPPLHLPGLQQWPLPDVLFFPNQGKWDT
jgi:hypothetical protein